MKRSIGLILSFLTAASLAAGQSILESWQFADDGGTTMDAVANVGSNDSSWNFGGFKTDGSGNLVIGQAGTPHDQDYTGAGTVSTYRKTDAFTALTTGIITMEVVVSDWDLDGANDGGVGNRGLSFALWDEPNNEKVFLQFETSTTDIRVQSTAPGANTTVTGSTASNGLGAYDMNGGGTVTFELNIDLDSGAWSSRVQTAANPIWVDLTTDGAGFEQITTVQLIRGTFDGAGQSISTWEAGEFVLVDSMTVSYAVPEPSTYALYGGMVALGLVMYRRRRG
jgi:hypothetical protein